ncbi:hypothetical protein HOG21_03255 [bacterium]|nr:hypothetical protein [bacterium]
MAIISVKNLRIIQLIKKLTNHKNKKNKGSVTIFNTGLIVTFISHKIIPQIIYVFFHHSIITHSHQGVFNKKAITYKINALKIIENSTFITIILINI